MVLIVAAALRFASLGWGIQHYDPGLAAGTGERTSFNSDEHIIVELVEAMRPLEGNIRPLHWVWGTLHCYVVAAALGAADLAGVFQEDWRAGLKAGHNQTLRRVFVVGRAVSAAIGVASVLLVFLIARHLADWRAGLWAGLVLAVSPIHVLHSHYLTPDVALGFWLLLAFLMALHSRFAWSGILTGLAVSAKVSGLPFVVMPVALALRARRRPWLALFGTVLGYLLVEPYAILEGLDWRTWMAHVLGFVGHSAPGELAIRPLVFYPVQLLVYGLGPVACVTAASGLRHADRRLWLPVALGVLSVFVTWVTMGRYLIPLIAFSSVAIGVRVARSSGRATVLAGALIVVPPLALSMAHLRLLRQPHTGQEAADWIARNVPAGVEIAQSWYVYPLLDQNRWRPSRLADPYGSGPFSAPGANYLVLDNMSLLPLRPELDVTIQQDYVEVACFARGLELFGLTLPEPSPAHDWKYTHPTIRIYRRRPRAAD